MTVGGGFKAIRYSLKAAKVVGFRKMFRASLSKNTCKPCALGMGGQKGGMADERGSFPEVCKKSFQAQITDIQPPIPKKLFQKKSIEDFRNTPPRLLERSGRLNTPLYKAKGDSHYSPLLWEEAIDKIVSQFKATSPERSFFYVSGRSSNEASFLLQLFARIYGTNNINNSSYYCHQASGVGIGSTIGTGSATIQLQDLEKADLIFVIGANPASNHPRFVRQLMNCRRRGGHVIVINPAKEKGLVKFAIPSDFRSMFMGGSPIASEYIQIQIGGDIALLKGIAKAVLEEGKHDLQFMENHTNGSHEYLVDVRETSWESIVSDSGISKESIQHIAQIYGNANNVIFSWAMGITHHEHGVDNVESIINVALLRGMIGRPYAGLLPLRGHSNIQGMGSVGVTPELKPEIFENIESHFGVQLPTTPGMDTLSCLKASIDGEIDFAFILGGNLYNASPDAGFTEKALNTIPFKIFFNTTLNHGHFYGVDHEVLILPVTARDEENQKTTQESMFNFVRLSDGGIVRLDNVRSEVEIISDIAQKVLGNSPIDFGKLKHHQNLRNAISQIVPGYEKMETMDNNNEEFHVSG
ncbi:MAG: molybdopterin-dependent oxidoreductase, partial [Bacteroidales bacterium]|nr:molybdopterin-dependent oxidoreductase [Bacteroidales bacterium]